MNLPQQRHIPTQHMLLCGFLGKRPLDGGVANHPCVNTHRLWLTTEGSIPCTVNVVCAEDEIAPAIVNGQLVRSEVALNCSRPKELVDTIIVWREGIGHVEGTFLLRKGGAQRHVVNEHVAEVEAVGIGPVHFHDEVSHVGFGGDVSELVGAPVGVLDDGGFPDDFIAGTLEPACPDAEHHRVRVRHPAIPRIMTPLVRPGKVHCERVNGSHLPRQLHARANVFSCPSMGTEGAARYEIEVGFSIRRRRSYLPKAGLRIWSALMVTLVPVKRRLVLTRLSLEGPVLDDL